MILCTEQECFKAILKSLGIDYDLLIAISLIFLVTLAILIISYYIYKTYFASKYCFKSNIDQLMNV